MMKDFPFGYLLIDGEKCPEHARLFAGMINALLILCYAGVLGLGCGYFGIWMGGFLD